MTIRFPCVKPHGTTAVCHPAIARGSSHIQPDALTDYVRHSGTEQHRMSRGHHVPRCDPTIRELCVSIREQIVSSSDRVSCISPDHPASGLGSAEKKKASEKTQKPSNCPGHCRNRTLRRVHQVFGALRRCPSVVPSSLCVPCDRLQNGRQTPSRAVAF